MSILISLKRSSPSREKLMFRKRNHMNYDFVLIFIENIHFQRDVFNKNQNEATVHVTSLSKH